MSTTGKRPGPFDRHASATESSRMQSSSSSSSSSSLQHSHPLAMPHDMSRASSSSSSMNTSQMMRSHESKPQHVLPAEEQEQQQRQQEGVFRNNRSSRQQPLRESERRSFGVVSPHLSSQQSRGTSYHDEDAKRLSPYDPYSPQSSASKKNSSDLVTTSPTHSKQASSQEHRETSPGPNSPGDNNEQAFLEMETASMGGDSLDTVRTTMTTATGRVASSTTSQQSPLPSSSLHYPSPYDPIKTSSGLLLTHRRTPAPLARSAMRALVETPPTAGGSRSAAPRFRDLPTLEESASTPPSQPLNRVLYRERFEVENPWSNTGNHATPRSSNVGWSYSSLSRDGPFAFVHETTRLLSYVRIWVFLSALILLLGTAIVLQHMYHENGGMRDVHSSRHTAANSQVSVATTSDGVIPLQVVDNGDVQLEIRLLPLPSHQQQQQQHGGAALASGTNDGSDPDHPQIVLMPFPSNEHGAAISGSASYPQQLGAHGGHGPHRILRDLRNEFEDWILHHGKAYHSIEEKERRFQIWSDNHFRTIEKNERHGPCKLTKQPVFGSNHFKDLTPEEFQSFYLTGYNAPLADEERHRRVEEVEVLGPHVTTTRHPVVHRRIQERWEHPEQEIIVSGSPNADSESGSSSSSSSSQTQRRRAAFNGSCAWYDVSCILKYIFENYLYGLGGIMEPAYDENSYPSAVDWRNVGSVSSVRSQGNCGGCWAITAVETIESAVHIATGTLYELSETEIIVCEEECEMCSGGWPQNAFAYVMENNGVPLRSELKYDGDFLLTLTQAMSGESDEVNEETVESYRNSICPAGSHSGDSDGSGGSGYSRYGGEIRGYGFATDKCTCYTDGSGCDCDSQNEGLAIRNLATYGPAVVCLDASVWQDYSGGILTSESGCSQGFMDVNHCVQAVGYAFVTDDEANDMEGGSHDQEENNSHDSKDGSGSRDDGTKRQGYWIVRNQWSTYWGMNGYAYVAMGENTCGILNDMLIAYT